MSGTRLFVGNVPLNTDVNSLHSAFSKFGNITNLDLKIKSDVENDEKKFAFITLSADNHNIESCIKHFSNEIFNGNQLHVTRARESFLERLQRERQESQIKKTILQEHIQTSTRNEIKPVEELIIHKRKIQHSIPYGKTVDDSINPKQIKLNNDKIIKTDHNLKNTNLPSNQKLDSDKKRIESLNKKRQEYKNKKNIIKTGLFSIDKIQNKKIVFNDNDDSSQIAGKKSCDTNDNTKKPKSIKNTLFDEEDSEDDVNFDIKEQYEGKNGQKVLDLQSRYKHDKRFMLDKRFLDETENNKNEVAENEEVELNQEDEKTKQLSILQDVLGVPIKIKKLQDHENKKPKPKFGMLRFDPSQPSHEKYLAPTDLKLNEKSQKKNKNKQKKEEVNNVPTPKVEVSKDQFYQISDSLKETMVQSTSFSIRSLFTKEENHTDAEVASFIPTEETKIRKIKNPLDPTQKNPFVYDSSESEDEDTESKNILPQKESLPNVKAVWKENLFFSKSDNRLTDALAYFNDIRTNDIQKDRRELKSLMKKRIHNSERKNQMFKKKIGGRKKSMKKSFNRKG